MRILIGHIAQASRYEVLCEGDACVVMGSRQKLKSYLIGTTGELGRGYGIKKAWLEDIMAGLMFGGAYAFDEEAYKIFLPHAQRAGLSVGQADFSLTPPAGLGKDAMHLMRVQKLPAAGR